MTVKEFYDAIGGDYAKAKDTLYSDQFISGLLKKFLMGNYYNGLVRANALKDVSEIFNVTHTLKGVAGNLSLTPLYTKASAICEATRGKTGGVDVSKEMDDLIETCLFVIRRIEEIE